MASRKKEAEGIALLSMYGDEDDDMEEDNDHDNRDIGSIPAEHDEGVTADMEEDALKTTTTSYIEPNTVVTSGSPVHNSTPPPQQVTSVEEQQQRRGRKGIVDYGHDEAALSPEVAEEGEIVVAGRVMFGAELQAVNGTPPGTKQLLTQDTQPTPPRSSDQVQSDALGNETECAETEETVNATTDDGQKEMDPLDNFLPPPPTTKCSDELQEKISKFLLLKKKTGRSFNSEVRNRKEYRNPDFLLHAVTYQDIDQIGSCFSKHVFDPHGYDKSDYYDEIEADLKRELERKEQEKKKNQKIDFLSGGTQSAIAVSTPKVIPVSAAAVPPIPSNPVSAAAAGTGRPNKKSKWDKVDGDRRHIL